MTNAQGHTAATVAEQGATVAPETASSNKEASRKKGAPKSQRTAKGANAKNRPKKEAAGNKAAKPVRAKEASMPRAESKGATIGEIMKATEWQAHSVRGYLSIAAKKHHIQIDSSKNEAGDRVYKIRK